MLSITQSGHKCRSKATASFQLQKRRIWKSLCCNTQWPQPHLSSIHHWKQLQRISETLVLSRFPTNLKEATKEVKLHNEVSKKYKKARDVTQCISHFGPTFRPLSSTPPCSLGTALNGVGVVQACRLVALQAFVRLFSFFRLQPGRKWRLKIQNREIFIHPCVIKAWKRDATCLKSFQWQQYYGWRISQWFRSAIWKKNSQETSQSNKSGWITPRWTARPREYEKDSKKKKNKFRMARLLKISFEDFYFEWSHVPKSKYP